MNATDCFHRSMSGLGSSKLYPATEPVPDQYFSVNPAENPLMYNWNKVYIKYCDGGSYSGSLDGPVIYNDTKVCSFGETRVFLRGWSHT